jgi:hypothetical protein
MVSGVSSVGLKEYYTETRSLTRPRKTSNVGIARVSPHHPQSQAAASPAHWVMNDPDNLFNG